MKISTCANYLVRRFLAMAFFLLGTSLATSCEGKVQGWIRCCDLPTATVAREINVLGHSKYEQTLDKMYGVRPTSQMFASQDVQLLSYTPRNELKGKKEGVVESTVDILCWSHEFGVMQYLMHINASAKFTVINVTLVQPVDKVLGQHYRFVIQPHGEDYTQINICHELQVKIKRRRLASINRIIERITYEKTNEKIDLLTPLMAAQVLQIANQISEPETGETQVQKAQVQKAQDKETQKQENSQSDQRTQPSTQIDLNDESKVDADEKFPFQLVITGAKVVSGEMRIAIYNSETQFKQHKPTKPIAQQGAVFRSKSVKITKSNQASLTVSFDELPDGTYAIAAFHDVNGNKQLDTSGLGLPTERYGFSRNARGMFGPPNYKSATIKVDDNNRQLKFRIK